MLFTRRIVTRIPLDELWTRDGILPLTRAGELTCNGVAECVRCGEVGFVCANVGEPLLWITSVPTFDFGKAVRDQIIDPEATSENDGEMRFRASEWSGVEMPTVILLEAVH
jgi:hypothetical protein